MPRFEVDFSENNSGGSWWLTDGDYRNLEEAGWKMGRVSSVGNHIAGASKVFTARDEHVAEATAIAEWESITGEDSEEIGCTCCGQPYSFWTSEVEGGDGSDFRVAVEEAREDGMSNEQMIRIILED